MIRLFVALPCYRVVEGRTAMSLCGLMRHLGAAEMDNQLEVVAVSMQSDTLMARCRHELVLQAQEREATHMLWLDADMVYPPETPWMLLRHEEPVVAANCITRNPPYHPCSIGMDGEYQWTEEGQKGLSPVQHVGLAVALTEMSVFEPMSKPYFQQPWSEEEDYWIGEDVFFMRQVRKSGTRIYVDHELSEKVQHLGEVPCDWNLARSIRGQVTVENAKADEPRIQIVSG